MRYQQLITLFFFLIINSINGVSQLVTQNEKGQFVTTISVFHPGKFAAIYTQKYAGSLYLENTQWHQGTLVYLSGEHQPIRLSLNLLNNELNGQFSDSSQFSLKMVNEFYFEEKRFIVHMRHTLGLVEPIYCELLVDGPIRLLKSYQQQIKRIDRAGSSDRPQPELISSNTFGLDGVLITTSSYYSQHLNELPKSIMPKRKVLLKLLSDKPGLVNKLIDTNDLTESELIRLFQAYNRADTNQ